MATFSKYEIERELGRGASGVVYLARDTSLQRRVALKVLVLPHTVQSGQRSQVVERFLREARAAAAIRHPSVPQIFEVGQEQGRPFIAMEYCEGQTLREVLSVSGPLSLAKVRDVATQILSGLQVAHQMGIVHRDIKPENIMLTPGTSQPRLMDFGIARAASDATITSTGAILGTPAYMSPEQVLGKPVDGRSDLFSVGILIHELLTGRRPFTGDTVTQITHAIGFEPPVLAPSLPPAVAPVIERALQKDPSQRFTDAMAMSAAFVIACEGGGRVAAPAIPSAPLQPTILGGPPSTGWPLAQPVFPSAPMAHPPGYPATNGLYPCPMCRKLVSPHAPSCPGCGHPIAVSQDPGGSVDIGGLNWGAFFLTVLWAISNRVWIGLVTLLGVIPLIGWVISLGTGVYLLIKGNELAWTSGRQWDSVDQFRRVQRAWAQVGLALMVLWILCVILVALADPDLGRSVESSDPTPQVAPMGGDPSSFGSPGASVFGSQPGR